MTLSAAKCSFPNAYDAIASALRLDPGSPTGLAWRDDYVAKRVIPGAQAGNWDERLKQWTVTAKGYPIYCRHAVWMLHTGKCLEKDTEIVFVDEDSTNLSVSNLKAVPWIRAITENTRKMNSAISETARIKRAMPVSIHISSPSPTYVVECRVKNRYARIAVASTLQEAVLIGVAAAMAFGYLDEAPIPRLDAGVAALVKRVCAIVYNPADYPAELTPGRVEAKQFFLNSLRQKMAQLGEQNGAQQ